MNIKWAYGLIAVLYILLIILRVINSKLEKQYTSEAKNSKQIYAIKADFFTTVAIACILVTLFINIAALVGGKSLNMQSIIITILVIGFTIINSFISVSFSNDEKTMNILGYTVKEDEFKEIKQRGASVRLSLDKDIESYSYVKMLVVGKDKQSFLNMISNIEIKPEEKDKKGKKNKKDK